MSGRSPKRLPFGPTRSRKRSSTQRTFCVVASALRVPLRRLVTKADDDRYSPIAAWMLPGMVRLSPILIGSALASTAAWAAIISADQGRPGMGTFLWCRRRK